MIIPRLRRERQEDARVAKAAGQPPPPIRNNFEDWRSSLSGEEGGFEGCVNVGCSADSLDAVGAFLRHEGVYGAFGIHPLNAEDWSEDVEDKLVDFMSRDKVVAWGECGLDYFDKNTRGQSKDHKKRELQRRVFARQMDLAASLGMPLVVHTRCAEEDTLELMVKHLPENHPVHVHCFTSSASLAGELLHRFPKLHLGFTGVVTFRSGGDVRDVVRQTPMDRLLLETDGPYMAPEPHRGRVAHPGHVAYVARTVAKVKGLPLGEVLRACRENTHRVYGF